MDCPRCGARLARLSLNGAESVYCEECRFADVESDHTRVSAGAESWDDALRRFRTAGAGGVDEAPASSAADDRDDGAPADARPDDPTYGAADGIDARDAADARDGDGDENGETIEGTGSEGSEPNADAGEA
jgi:hypothetical protein